MQRDQVVEIILSTLRDFAAGNPSVRVDDLSEESGLFGSEGRLDSLALVTVVLDVEECVNRKTGRSITIADERAMSQKRSPFRTVRTLADYVEVLLAEGVP